MDLLPVIGVVLTEPSSAFSGGFWPKRRTLFQAVHGVRMVSSSLEEADYGSWPPLAAAKASAKGRSVPVAENHAQSVGP